MRLLSTGLRISLCLILGFAGLAKFLTGWDSGFFFPEWVFYCSAAIDTSLALFFAAGVGVERACYLSIVIAVTGLLLFGMAPGRPCGCFGNVGRDVPALRVMLSASLGALASLLLLARQPRPGRVADMRSRAESAVK